MLSGNIAVKPSKEIQKLFSEFTAAYLPIQASLDPSLSLKKYNKVAQDVYLQSITPNISNTTFFQVLHNDEIHGDTGNNAFLPPKEIEMLPKKFTLEDFSCYSHYQPAPKLAKKIEKTYKYFGFLPASYAIDVTFQGPYAMTYGHGTTEIFDAILSSIIKNKRDIIIVPTPTYGLFIPLMKQCKVVPLPSNLDNIGAVDSNVLSDLILELENKNKIYFSKLIKIKIRELKSNIDMGDEKNLEKIFEELNNISMQLDYSDSQSLDELISKYNNGLHILKKEKIIHSSMEDCYKLPTMPRVRALYSVNPAMPSGKVLTQCDIDKVASVLKKHPSITLIEDVTHRGILLDESRKMGSFTKSEIVDQTVVLDGISKIFGSPKARAAFVIGANVLINPIADKLHMKSCTFNGASDAFLKGVYDLGPEKIAEHLKDISQGYQQRLKLLTAVLYGINSFPAGERQTIQKNFLKQVTKKITDVEKQFVFSGIEGVKFYTKPEAGYFVLLDFTEHVGKYLGGIKLNTGMDFRNIFFSLADVNSISDIMCYDAPSETKAYLRYSMSMDTELDMVEGLLRMKKLLSYCSFEPLVMKLSSVSEAQPLLKRKPEKEESTAPCKKRRKETPLLTPMRTSSRIANKPSVNDVTLNSARKLKLK